MLSMLCFENSEAPRGGMLLTSDRFLTVTVLVMFMAALFVSLSAFRDRQRAQKRLERLPRDFSKNSTASVRES